MLMGIYKSLTHKGELKKGLEDSRMMEEAR
jgi:hypothetical protein